MVNDLILKLFDAALAGNSQAASMHMRKFASKIRTEDPELYDQIIKRFDADSLRSGGGSQPLPVDTDSRLNLVKVETPYFDRPPVYEESVAHQIDSVLEEYARTEELLRNNLTPTKSMLFVGPPGVGKTMSARWLAYKLNLPLLILDLATVMSSFLGKTGNNIRSVIDHAASFPCVLLLDEFDSIAKRRDDDAEVGELKRLVTVLLQAIDDWPTSSVLIAATNHGELLDPAIWRRFDHEVRFSLPKTETIVRYLTALDEFDENYQDLAGMFEGMSFSDIRRTLNHCRKEHVLSGKSLSVCVLDRLHQASDKPSLEAKKSLAVKLSKAGWSQRKIEKELGISRPTIKKALDESTCN